MEKWEASDLPFIHEIMPLWIYLSKGDFYKAELYKLYLADFTSDKKITILIIGVT